MNKQAESDSTTPSTEQDVPSYRRLPLISSFPFKLGPSSKSRKRGIKRNKTDLKNRYILQKEKEILSTHSQMKKLPYRSFFKGFPPIQTSPEDKYFVDDFEQMVSDDSRSRSVEGMKLHNLDIPVPLFCSMQGLNKQENSSAVKYALLLKKGSKHQWKNLAIPENPDTVARLRRREEEKRTEWELLKRLTLDLMQRLQIEEFSKHDKFRGRRRNRNHYLNPCIKK